MAELRRRHSSLHWFLRGGLAYQRRLCVLLFDRFWLYFSSATSSWFFFLNFVFLCTMLFSRGLYQISRNIRGSLNGCRRFISGRRQDHQFLLSHNYQSPGCSTDTVISLRSFTCTLFDFGQPLLVVKQRKLQRNPYFLLLRSEVQNLVSTFTHLVPKWNDDF